MSVDKAYGFTVLTKTPRAWATKIVRRALPSGSPDFEPCGNGWEFIFTPLYFVGLNGLQKLLVELAGKRDKFIIRGTPITGLDLTKGHRRLLYADPDTGAAATLVEMARAWIAVDVDGVLLGYGLGRPERFADGAVVVRDKILGGNFTGIGCIATPTSQSGFVGDDTWRGRLWFLLSDAVPDRVLFEFFDGMAKAKRVKTDPSVFGTHQPNYTARCKFFAGCGFTDPFPREQWVQRIPAALGRGDIVQINVAALGGQYAAERRAAAAKTAAVYRSAGGGFAGRLATIGAGDDANKEFHTPLKGAIGAAVAEDLPLHEVQERIEKRLEETADAKRLKDYSARWIARTYASFEKKHRTAEAEADAAIARLNSIFHKSSKGK